MDYFGAVQLSLDPVFSKKSGAKRRLWKQMHENMQAI